MFQNSSMLTTTTVTASITASRSTRVRPPRRTVVTISNAGTEGHVAAEVDRVGR